MFDTVIEVQRILKDHEERGKMNFKEKSAMNKFYAYIKNVKRTRGLCCTGIETAKKIVRAERRECASCEEKIEPNET